MNAPINAPPIKKWSFSALKDYEECPYRVYLKRVERAPTPDISGQESHPLVRGDRIHKEAEAFVRGEGPLTKDLRKFSTELEGLQQRFTDGTVQVEQEWGFTKEWAVTDWRDPACWAMIKADVVDELDGGLTLHVIDYKTGKKFGNEVKHQQQVQLYSLGAFMRYPEAQLVKTSLYYLDEGKDTTRTYTRPFVNEILPRWTERASRMTNAMVFPPKPNKSKCRYCSYGTANGSGACPYATSE